MLVSIEDQCIEQKQRREHLFSVSRFSKKKLSISFTYIRDATYRIKENVPHIDCTKERKTKRFVHSIQKRGMKQ